MKVEATPIYLRGGKKLCVCFILFFSAAETAVVTGIPAVMKTILYAQAIVVAETTRRARVVVAVKTIRLVLAVVAVKMVQTVRIVAETMYPCRIFALRRGAVTIVAVAVPGMGGMEAIVFAAMCVTIAVSMLCVVAAIAAETECIIKKKAAFAAFFDLQISYKNVIVRIIQE